MALWYQPPPPPHTLNRISPTLKLNSLHCTCSYNLSISNFRPTHIPKLEPEPVFTSVKTFVPATVANLGPSFDFLSCAIDGLRDFISLSINLSVHPGKISITKISSDAVENQPRSSLQLCWNRRDRGYENAPNLTNGTFSLSRKRLAFSQAQNQCLHHRH